MKERKNLYAGQFYPQNPQVLHEMILSLSISFDSNCEISSLPSDFIPRILIAPHAGYVFSGMLSAWVYKNFMKRFSSKKLLVIGPSHYEWFENFGLSSFDYFETSFGPLKVDKSLQEEMISFYPSVFEYQDNAHKKEHSIEVQLPFIKSLLWIDNFVPVLTGLETDYSAFISCIYSLLSKYPDLWIVISTDLSHFLPYDKAYELDSKTIQKIKNLEDTIISEEACGFVGLNLAIGLAKKMGYSFYDLCYLNSWDVTWSEDSVVWYLSWFFGK